MKGLFLLLVLLGKLGANDHAECLPARWSADAWSEVMLYMWVWWDRSLLVCLLVQNPLAAAWSAAGASAQSSSPSLSGALPECARREMHPGALEVNPASLLAIAVHG